MPIGSGLLAAGVAAAAVFAWMFSSGNGGTTPGGGGGGTTPGGGGGGGGGTTPGGGGGGGGGTTPTQPGKPPAGARINPATIEGGNAWWGDPSKIPANFDWNGNGIFIHGGCEAVAIGAKFAPEKFTLVGAVTRQMIETLQTGASSATKLAPDGPLWNFWLHLIFDEGFEQPEDLPARVLAEVAPFCAEMPDDLWPAGLKSFYDAFVKDAVEFHEGWAE